MRINLQKRMLAIAVEDLNSGTTRGVTVYHTDTVARQFREVEAANDLQSRAFMDSEVLDCDIV